MPFPFKRRRRAVLAELGALGIAAATLSFGPALAEERTVTVDGLDIRYEIHGDLASGEAPILLLHGGMLSAAHFSELIPIMVENRPVIAIDQQGHGRTGDRDAPITLASMRADTLGVLDALDIETAHVVGFSMGGMLGLELAVNAPDRVATLSALSASQNIEGMLPQILEMNRDPNAQPSPEVAELMPSEEDFAQMQAGFADNPGGPEQFGRTMEKLNALMTSGWGWSDAELEGIAAPTLIAIGDRDFILPEHAARMAELIPDAQLAILPDTTHMTMLERDDWLAPMIEHRIATGGKR